MLLQDEGNRKDDGSIGPLPKSKIRLFVLFGLVCIFFQMMLMNPVTFNRLLKEEVLHSYEALGNVKWREVTEKSRGTYELMLVESGFKEHYIDKVMRETYNPNPLAKKFEKLLPMVDRMMANIQIVTYQLIHRAYLIKEWAWLLIPFAVGSMASAFYYWRIRMFSFGNSTKSRLLIIRKSSFLVVAALVVFFFVPAFYPPAAPYLPVILMVSLILFARKYIMRMQKHW